jgi:hypothetical protein
MILNDLLNKNDRELEKEVKKKGLVDILHAGTILTFKNIKMLRPRRG